MATDTLLTPEEIAEFMNVSRGTVRHWVRTKKLSAIVLPGDTRIRIERCALDEFLADHRQEKASSAGNGGSDDG